MTDALSPQGALRAGCALTLTGLALTIAACGGSGGNEAGASDSAADRDAARVRLQECLRKQGVDDLGERRSSGQGGSQGQGANQGPPSEAQMNKLRKAMDGPCKKYRQKAFGNITAQDRREMEDRMVKFSACMRKHGVNMPTPRPGGGPVEMRINPNSPRIEKATEACRKLLPKPPGGGKGDGPRGGGFGIEVGPAPGGGSK